MVRIIGQIPSNTKNMEIGKKETSRDSSTSSEHNKKKSSWKQKYCYMRDQVQQEIPEFTIRSKNETAVTRFLWQIVNMIFHLFWGFDAPNMSKNHTTVMRTLWTGSDWSEISYLNKWMILCHERRYLLLLWKGKTHRFKLFRYIYQLLRMILFRSYRQNVMEICWQENINYHVESNEGSLNHHVRRGIIRTLSGPEFAYSFTKQEAKDCIERMAQRAVKLYKEKEQYGRQIKD